MNIEKMDSQVADELRRIAKIIVAIEFDSEKAMKKYLKEHPEADKSKHRVKKNGPKKPSKEKPLYQLQNASPSWRKKFDEIGDAQDAVLKSYGGTGSVAEREMENRAKSGDPKAKKDLEKFKKLLKKMGEHRNVVPSDVDKELSVKKVNPSKKSLRKVKSIMDAHKIKEDSDELKELAGFKRTLGQRMPEKDIGKYVVRNVAKLKKDFIKNMDPSNYSSKDAFESAKKRIDKMPTSDFGKVLAAINDDEEEE